MIKVRVSPGMFALIDDEDYSLVAKYDWNLCNPYKGRLYARAGGGGSPHVYMHRLVLGLMGRRTPGIDHVNGDSLDNRKENLRTANHSQNGANSRVRKHSSIFKGVHWSARHKRWRARIKVKAKQINLGYHRDEVQAARAYDEAALRYFGEFARTNEMMGLYKTKRKTRAA